MSGTPPRSRPSRRRPRPPSLADEGAERRGQSGRSQLEVLMEALSLSEKSKIDMLLKRRQLEEPINGVPDAAEASSNGRGAAGGGARGGHELPMSADELAEAYADVYGRPPPDVARSEERLMAVEREVGRLPPSEREALTKAIISHPLLFVNCPHTKMILEERDGDDGEGGEDFDAAAAARRLARYWERRRALFGDRTCYAPGTFQRHKFSDYKRLYERTLAVAADPDADGEAQENAKDWLKVVHDVKLQALNAILEQERDAAVDNGEHILLALQSVDELKLQFLRAEDFDETKAVQRMIFYWKMGLHLFGPNFLRRRSVGLDEIEDCLVLFGLRQWRLMPKEDEYGRSILLFRQIICNDGDEENDDCLSRSKMLQLGINEDHYAKVVWYVLQASLERESCQRNGFVLLFDLRVRHGHFNKLKSYRHAGVNVINCFPAKLCAVHLVLGQQRPWWQRIMNGISVFDMSLRRRCIVHAGAINDTVAKFGREFGIGRENLPADLGGTVDEEYFSHWLEERRVSGL